VAVAILSIVGVLRDGSIAADADENEPIAQRIDWPRAEDGKIKITVYRQDGSRANVTDTVITLTIRTQDPVTSLPAAAPIVSRAAVITSGPNGEAEFSIAASDVLSMQLLERRIYRYDVWIQDATSARQQIVPESQWVVDAICGYPTDVPTAPPPVTIQLVPASRRVDAGPGLAGGGDLSADRTISMPNVGPGAGPHGASDQFLRQLTLDAQGRVLALSGEHLGDAITAPGLPFATGNQWINIFVDYDGGDDGNIGHLLAAPGATFSGATLTGVPLKTLEEVERRYGHLDYRKRRVQIMIKTRTGADKAYYDKDGVTVSSLRWFPRNADRVIIRASLDLSNDAIDKVRIGHVQSTGAGYDGPGAGESWTVGSWTGATFRLQVASGTLGTVEQLRGLRVRMTSGASNGSVFGIQRVIGTDTLVLMTLGGQTAPAAGNTFVIEEPGVKLFALTSDLTSANGLSQCIAGLWLDNGGSGSSAISVSGSARLQFAACRARGGDVVNLSTLVISRTWLDDVGAGIHVGAGLRTDAQMNVTNVGQVSVFYIATPTGTSFSMIFRSCHTFDVGLGSLFPTFPLFYNCGAPAENGLQSSTSAQFGSRGLATVPRTYVYIPRTGPQGMRIERTSMAIHGVDVNGQTAAAFQIIGNGGFVSFDDVVSSDGGNTDVIVDVSQARNVEVSVGVTTACTAVGSNGVYRDADSVTADWSRFVSGSGDDKRDKKNNHIQGTAGCVPTKRTPGTIGNLPILAADPSSPVDGDAWIYSSGGTRELRVRIGGTTYRSTLAP
jgi:hypothetical protein